MQTKDVKHFYFHDLVVGSGQEAVSGPALPTTYFVDCVNVNYVLMHFFLSHLLLQSIHFTLPCISCTGGLEVHLADNL
jgi:hypothetical protein